MSEVEFYYDLVSPFSYLAWDETKRICRENGADLVLRPVLLGAVHKLSGNRAPIEVPAKGRYQMRDMQRWVQRYGLSMKFPRPFPFRTVTTMRAAVYCEGEGKLFEFTEAGFRIFWEQDGAPEGLEADETEAVSRIAESIGLSAKDVLEGAGRQDVKDSLKKNTEAAVERGVFGTPTYFIGDEMFWGNDRLDFVEEALAKN